MTIAEATVQMEERLESGFLLREARKACRIGSELGLQRIPKGRLLIIPNP